MDFEFNNPEYMKHKSDIEQNNKSFSLYAIAISLVAITCCIITALLTK